MDAAVSTTDPNDTGVDVRRLGRIAGYFRGRKATGAFTPRAPKGLLAVGTSVILWRDSRAAGASIERDIAESRRFRGKAVEGGVLVDDGQSADRTALRLAEQLRRRMIAALRRQ